ncbi:MAG: LuxR C-terminal-related transcriptional regulator [Cellulophaga sp.]
MKNNVLLFFLLCGINLQAQNAISGYVNIEDEGMWGLTVHLTQINIKNGEDYTNSKLVASSVIEKDGYFSFDKKSITSKNSIYRIHVNPIEGVTKNSVKNDQLFILSRADAIRFEKGEKLFSKYTNTNQADVEWQRLRKFEAIFYDTIQSEKGKSLYVNKMKSYTKDSLRILLVKLISIKELENKKLLEKDIVTNPGYYVTLLEELKESDLDRLEYQFLEEKLTFIATAVIAEKYKKTKTVNILLLVVVFGLVFFGLWIRKNKNTRILSDLSNQEKNIQNLILEGKSNKEIANELFISLSTVKTHITSIYSKLQVSSRKELLQRR